MRRAARRRDGAARPRESRETAQRLIMAGRVRVNSRPARQARSSGSMAATDIALTARSPTSTPRRGAYKLIAALDHFAVDVAGRRALDVGASTGGFTDVLLKRGAAQRDRARCRLRPARRAPAHRPARDRTRSHQHSPRHARSISRSAPIWSSSTPASFRCKLVLPAVLALAAPKAEIIALVKPQFEVGKGKVGKGGIVRDDALRAECGRGILDFAAGIGPRGRGGSIESPIQGAKGNREYLT